MNDKTVGKPAETGPETAQHVDKPANVDTTVAPAQAPATGPSFQLQYEDQDLANIRIQTCHKAGEPCPVTDLAAKDLGGEEGNCCIVAVATPVYGGADMLSAAVGGRQRVPLKLVPNDKDGKEIKGDFVVGRFSPSGLFNGEQQYTIVLENAGPEKEEKKEA